VGKGTTIQMYFPAVSTPPEVIKAAVAVRLPQGGHERILVVDDEEGVRQVAMRVLSKFGYDVDGATDGEHALAKVRGAPTPFDLVLTDLAMPKMNGLRLSETLRREHPAVPVVLMSGYAPEEAAELKDAGADLAVLNKPWSTGDLIRRVRESLDGAPVEP
jgi:CheY-like chemotaxis protein